MVTTLWGRKSAPISVTGAGTHEIVATVSGKKLAITKLLVFSDSAITVTVKDDGGTTIIGAVPLAANSGFVLPADGEEWGHSASGKSLQLTLSGAATVGGYVGYEEQ